MVIADINEDKLCSVHYGRAVKTDNNIQFEKNKVSIWSWDDESKGYLLNDEKTTEYEIVELVNLDDSIKGKFQNVSKLYEYIRNALKKGLKVYPSIIDSSCNVLISIDYKSFYYEGIFLSPKQYSFNDGVIKANITEDRPELCYAEYGKIDESAFVSTGGLPKIARNFALGTSFIAEKKFPLIDILSLAKKAVEEYFEKSHTVLGVNFTEEQVSAILESADLDLAEYADASSTVMNTILSETGVSGVLHGCITKLDPNGIEIEKYLSRNEDFQDICCEKVRSQVLQSMVTEKEQFDKVIEELKNRKSGLEQEVQGLNSRNDELQSAIERKEKLATDVRELQEMHETLLEEMNNDKRMFIDKIMGEALIRSSPFPSSCSVIVRSYPEEEMESCEKFEDLIKNLKENLKNCLDSDISFSDISYYVTAAIRKGMNLIICNDHHNVVANCISSLFDGKLCSSIDASNGETSAIINSINALKESVVVVNGSLNTLDYAQYFTLCKYSDKVLIFSCDDGALLSSAPSEIWAYSMFLDLSGMSIISKKMTKYTKYRIFEESNIESDSESNFIDSLENNEILTSMQSSLLRDIERKIGKNDCELLQAYVRQIAISNGKINEFERVQSHE